MCTLGYEALEDQVAVASTLENLGGVHQGKGQDQADLLQAQGDHLRPTVALFNMAMVHEEQGNYREALRLLEDVIALDRRSGHSDLKRDMEAFGRIREKLDAERDARR